jgi:Mn-dependent DtxR family transcriptional regulator
MNELSGCDRYLLRLVSRRRAYREMARSLGVALATVQHRLRRLKRTGYIIGPSTRKARSLGLTQKGQNALRRRKPLR